MNEREIKKVGELYKYLARDMRSSHQVSKQPKKNKI